MSDSVADLTVRQFHAKYPLQVKRRAGTGGRPVKRARKRKKTPAKVAGDRGTSRRATSGDGTPDRAAIRQVLIGFAKDVSAASSQSATIDVLAGIDTYVDRIVKARR